MRIVHRLVAATVAAAVAFWGAGCGSGDSTPATDQPDASAPPKDAGRDARPPPPPVDAGEDAFVGDADAGDVDAGIDAGKVVPGSPSRALAAGATVSKSESFKAIRTLGESPGGNGTASSQSYRFHGGLVGSTQ